MNRPVQYTAVVMIAVLAATLTFASDSRDAAFLAETRASMQRMMSAMDSAPVGNVDRDFVAMMVPHHQGAIDMARAELRYGHNEQLHRIAQEIIVDQQQEITAMRLAVSPAQPADGAKSGQ
jgi:uncharacterized protein (DUF305 family)